MQLRLTTLRQMFWSTRLFGACALLGGCVGNQSMESATAGPSATVSKSTAFPPGGLRRLTTTQYTASVTDLLGNDIALVGSLDLDVPLDNLDSLGAGSVTTTPTGAMLYDTAARSLSAQRFANPNEAVAFVGCTPDPNQGANDACATAFLQRFGRQAWRRPLTAEEQSRLLALYAAVTAADGNVLNGAQAMTAALLASPYFLYRVEIGDLQSDGSRNLTGYELATRLSFFLWNTTPDEALLQAAANGDLASADGLEAQAKRLLADDRAKVALTAFVEQWLGFVGLEGMSKDSNTYRQMSPTLGASMHKEFDADLQDLMFDPNADFTTLFTSRTTYLNQELASLYGVTWAAGNANFVKTTLPDTSNRGGLLTLGGFLAAQAKSNATAPIARGHYVRSRLLCQAIPNPPANVANLPSGDSNGQHQTMRTLLSAHTASPSCSGCHKSMDPLGLPLEHFDGIGAYRDTDQGLTLDVTGDLDGAHVDGALTLGQALQNSSEVQLCIVKQMYRNALGQEEAAAQEPLLTALAQHFQASHFHFQSFLLDFVRSDAFRKAGVPR